MVNSVLGARFTMDMGVNFHPFQKVFDFLAQMVRIAIDTVEVKKMTTRANRAYDDSLYYSVVLYVFVCLYLHCAVVL